MKLRPQMKYCQAFLKKSYDRRNIDSSIVTNLRNESDCFNLLQFSAMPSDQFGEIIFEYSDLFERFEIEAIERDVQCRANFVFK